MSRRKRQQSSLRHVDRIHCLDSSEDDDADSNLSFCSHLSSVKPGSKTKTRTKRCQSISRNTKRPTKKTLKNDDEKTMDDNSNYDDDEESELEVPYAHNFDETQIRLQAELDDVRKEPLRPGDVIVYHHPVFVKEIRVAQVIAIVNPTNSSEQQHIPLELSNGECLEADTNIQRIREYRKGTLYPHAGISRPIQNYVLKSTKRKLPENQRLTKVKLQQLKNRILVAKDDKNHRHDDNSSSSSSSFLRQTQQALQQLPPRWIRLSKEFQQNSQIMLMPHESTGSVEEEEETKQQVLPIPSLEKPNTSQSLDLSIVITRRNNKKRKQPSQQQQQQQQQQQVSTRSPSDSHSIPQNIQQLETTTNDPEIYDLSSSPCSKKTKSIDRTPNHQDDTLSKSSNPSKRTEHHLPTKSKLASSPHVHGTGFVNSDDDDDDSQDEEPSTAPTHRSSHPSNENKLNPSLQKPPTRKKIFWDGDDEHDTTGTVTAATRTGASEKINQREKDPDNNLSSQDDSVSTHCTRVLTSKKTTKHWKFPFAKDGEAEDSSDDDDDDKLPASVLRTTKQHKCIPKRPPRDMSQTSRSSQRTIQSFITICGNEDESSPTSEEEKIKKIQVEEFQSIMSQLSNASTQQGSLKARTGKKIFRESMSSTSSSSPFSYASSAAIRHRPAYQKKPPESSPSSEEDDLSFFRRIRYSVDPSVRNTSKQCRASSTDDRGYSSIDDSVTVTDKSNRARPSKRLDNNAHENDTQKKRKAVLMHARRPFTTTTNHATISSNNYRKSRQLELQPLPRR